MHRPARSPLEGPGDRGPSVTRFDALDGWRGVCALVVTLYHLSTLGHFYADPFVRNSYLLVDFFFVLSGFVISHAYLDRLRGAGEAGRFMLRRFARVWPLHAAMLALFLALEFAKFAAGGLAENRPFTGSASPRSLLLDLALLNAFGLHGETVWNFPSWSIGAEFWTYLVFVGFASWTPRAARTAVAALIATSAGVAVAVLGGGSMDVTHDYGFLRCVYGFFVGHLAHRAWLAGGGTGPRWPNLAEPAAVLLALLLVVLGGAGPAALAAPLVFAGMVLAFAHGPGRGGAISALMGSAPAQRLGVLSYAIYMVHAFVVLILWRAALFVGRLLGFPVTVDTPGAAAAAADGQAPAQLLSLGGPYAMDLLAVAYLAGVVALASPLHRLVEVPGSRLALALGGRRRLAGRGSATP